MTVRMMEKQVQRIERDLEKLKHVLHAKKRTSRTEKVLLETFGVMSAARGAKFLKLLEKQRKSWD